MVKLGFVAIFKLTVNPPLQIYKYPILNIDDLYSKVSDKHYFTRLDIFQCTIDQLFQVIAMTAAYIDNILILGKNMEENITKICM